MTADVHIETIIETCGDGIEKDAPSLTYTPPTDEPLHDKILLSYSPRTEVWITGRKHDLIDIVSNYALVVRDYVREDSYFDGSDIHGNHSVIAARAGRKNDLAVMYGLVYDGDYRIAKAVDVIRFYIRDGSDIGVSVVGSEVFVLYGWKKDLRTRFAYSEAGGWMRSPGNNRGGRDFPPVSERVRSTRLPAR